MWFPTLLATLRSSVPRSAARVQLAVDAAQRLDYLDRSVGAPTQCHMPVARALNAGRVLQADGDHRLDHVREGPGSSQSGL